MMREIFEGASDIKGMRGLFAMPSPYPLEPLSPARYMEYKNIFFLLEKPNLPRQLAGLRGISSRHSGFSSVKAIFETIESASLQRSETRFLFSGKSETLAEASLGATVYFIFLKKREPKENCSSGWYFLYKVKIIFSLP